MRGSVVACGTLSSTVAPIHCNRIESLRFRVCFSTSSVSHGGGALPTRCLSLLSQSQRPNNKANKEARLVSLQCRSKFRESEDDFVVVNFYRFVFIKDPKAEVAKHLSFMEVPLFSLLIFFFFFNFSIFIIFLFV